ncbi:hypothetical protein KX729_32650 [Rhizobium sp. XQZ8]|uniref:hypothetical protein n=1 Tax=Rhizobium populisoli TaxID=2859785 RepID=UPI001CA53CB9|nr:hypothetical protein [Rhizobium populisoli]MBW6426112.1 hypothetical protein [Rhizobium populisoli]
MDNILVLMALISGGAAVGATVGYLMYGDFRGRNVIIAVSAGMFGAIAVVSALL